jgi:RimJ/RimL family protein N-acetyltransferase
MNPLLLNFPEEFESERLVIRAPRPGDGPELNAAVLETLDDLRPWMPWAQTAPTVEESEENIRRAAARFALREDLRLNAYLKSTGEFVVGTGLHRPDWSVPRLEIGYWVRRRFAGQGYVTESTARLARFAFEHLAAERVEIRCDDKNHRSARIPERLGFALEGTLRHDSRTPTGELRNTRVYALVRDQATSGATPASAMSP